MTLSESLPNVGIGSLISEIHFGVTRSSVQFSRKQKLAVATVSAPGLQPKTHSLELSESNAQTNSLGPRRRRPDQHNTSQLSKTVGGLQDTSWEQPDTFSFTGLRGRSQHAVSQMQMCLLSLSRRESKYRGSSAGVTAAHICCYVTVSE